MLKNKIINFAENCIIIPALIIIGYLVLSSLFFQTHIQFHTATIYSYEFATISTHSLIMILFLLFGLCFFIYFKKYLIKISPQKLFLSCMLIYCVAALFLILQSPIILKDDALMIFNSAKNILDNNYDTFNPTKFYINKSVSGYIFHNPHQLGLLYFEQIFMHISNNPRLFFFINFIAVLVTNFVLWKLAETISKNNKTVCNYTILLSFLFYPQLFFILFVYGILISNMFLVSAFYFFVKFIKDKQKRNLIYHILLATMAVLIKKNCMIGIIAFIILFVIQFIKDKKIILLLSPILLVATIFSSSFLLKQYYGNKIGHEINDGMPMLSYVMMGISSDIHTGRIGGWWNGYNIDSYQANKFNQEETIKNVKIDIKNRLQELWQNPKDTYKFFTQKIISMWTDPMFQSIWSGPIQKTPQFSPNNLLFRNFSQAGSAYITLATFADLIMLAIYFFAFLYIFTHKKINSLWLFPYLYFIGGFLFHIFWEAKSQYATPYIIILIPVCAQYLATSYTKNIQHLSCITSYFTKIYNKIKNCIMHINSKIVYIALIAVQMSICIYFANNKQALYCDEIFAYGLANSSEYSFLDKSSMSQVSNTGWVTKDFYDNYVKVDKTKPFSFSVPYHNNENDVHPPFHYMLLHIASYFTDTLSKWPGIILNLIILIFFDFVFFYFADSIFKNKVKSIAAIGLFTLSSAGLSNIVFIRMYFLLTFIFISYIAIHFHIIRTGKLSAKNCLLLFLCVITGGLTHYYFYICAFITSSIFALYIFLHKKFFELFYYISALLGGFIFNINYFPALITHVFFRNRGTEILEKIDRNNLWIGEYIYFIDKYMFVGCLYLLIALIIFAIVYALVNMHKKQRHNILQNLKINKNSALIYFILYIYIIAVLAHIQISFDVNRYVSHLYPLLSVLTLYSLEIIYVGFSIKSKKITTMLSATIATLFIIFNIKCADIDYQYPEFTQTLKNLEKTKGYDALIYYDYTTDQDQYTSYQLKTLYDETFLFDKQDIPNLKHIVAQRKTKDPLVLMIPKIDNPTETLENISNNLGVECNEILSYQRMRFYLIK